MSHISSDANWFIRKMDSLKVNVKKIKFGPEIFYGDTPDAVPYVQLSPLDDEIVASYTGPDSGLAYAEGYTVNNCHTDKVAGVRDWNLRQEQAYGISISLYEQHPITGKISGEPIADSFAMCVRGNNAVLMVADGVNWGEKSRLAARCALYGSMKYINTQIFEKRDKPENTQDVIRVLRKALDEAHNAIMLKEGGLTTLCLCMVCAVDNSDQYAVCCVNVGDSFGYVYSSNQNIREITVGSHDVGSERDIRDAGGAIGPVNGIDPELHNLTCSVTFCHRGDILFLTTDGISDNFDPVVTKIALPMREDVSNVMVMEKSNANGSQIIKPELTPRERHIYAMKEMERVIHEFELITEDRCTAQSFCGAILQHVLSLTNTKRKIVENPAVYTRRKMSREDRQLRDSEIVEKMSKAPGKLDHATIVAIEVGAFTRSQDDEDLSLEVSNGGLVTPLASASGISQPGSISESPPTPTHLPLCGSIPLPPPNQLFKKSGARKLFSKLKSTPSSPTTPNTPPLSSSAPGAPPRFFSPVLPSSASTPLFPQDSSRPTLESTNSVYQPGHLRFPQRKMPNQRQAKTPDVHSPASPAIVESPQESDDT